MATRVLEALSFDNTFARLPEAFYAKLNPTPFSDPPYLVSFNPSAAALIDLDPSESRRPEFPGVLEEACWRLAWSRWSCYFRPSIQGVYPAIRR